jgi:hypothetical protein
MSLGFPVKIDWDGPDDLPELLVLPAEVCREYYEEKDIQVILDWLDSEYDWCINEVKLLNEDR